MEVIQKSIKIFLALSTPIFLLPLLWVLVTSFRSDAGLFTIGLKNVLSSLTIDNFILLFYSNSFGKWLLNSLICSFFSSFFSTIVGFAFTFELVFSSKKVLEFSRGLVLLAYLIPSMFAIFSVQYLYLQIFDISGILRLIVIYPLFLIPVAVWIGSGYITTIPQSIIKLAIIDGLRFQERIKYIFLPYLLPGFFAAFSLCFIIAFQEYVFGIILLSENSTFTIPVGVVKLQAGDVYQWGVISAAAVITASFCGVIVTVASEQIIGALKKLLRTD